MGSPQARDAVDEGEEQLRIQEGLPAMEALLEDSAVMQALREKNKHQIKSQRMTEMILRL